ATNAPGRITRLVLANTSPRFPDSTPMETRRRTVLESGMAAVADVVLGRFFQEETRARDPHAASVREVLLATDPVGYAGCCAAVRDWDNVAALRRIDIPTLVIVGDHDQSTPWTGHGEILAREISGAKVVRYPTAHLSNIERPRSFTAALLEFLVPDREGISVR